MLCNAFVIFWLDMISYLLTCWINWYLKQVNVNNFEMIFYPYESNYFCRFAELKFSTIDNLFSTLDINLKQMYYLWNIIFIFKHYEFTFYGDFLKDNNQLSITHFTNISNSYDKTRKNASIIQYQIIRQLMNFIQNIDTMHVLLQCR